MYPRETPEVFRFIVESISYTLKTYRRKIQNPREEVKKGTFTVKHVQYEKSLLANEGLIVSNLYLR